MERVAVDVQKEKKNNQQTTRLLRLRVVLVFYMTKARKYTSKAKRKIKKVLHEFKEGVLKSGTNKKKVRSRKQAIAIALSEAREAGARILKKKRKGK